MPNFDLVLEGGQVVVPAANQSRQLKIEKLNIGVQDGKIAAVEAGPLQGRRKIDCQNRTVLPGVIDSQVHFREPGMTHKEDLETGSKAAALGGITSFFEMPNTIPATTTEELFFDKMKRAENRCWTNYAFYIGGSPENVDQLAKLELLPGCSGIKIFMGSSTGTLLVEDEKVLKKILASGRRRVIVHSEDELRLRERKHIAVDSQSVLNHHVWRDVETAVRSTTKLLRLSRETSRPVHVLHVSTAEEIPLIKAHKDLATMEVLPQHLTFAAPECYEKLGSKAQQNPPIREARHREALWQALREGIVDVIGSDHAPHTLEEKAKPYPTSPSGMPMVQTLLPLMLNHVNEGRLSLLRLAELVCESPRHLFGCTSKGRIEVGLDADFTIIDLKKKHTYRNSEMASRAAWTPLDGVELQGMPVMSLIAGEILMEEGRLAGRPLGRPVHFKN